MQILMQEELGVKAITLRNIPPELERILRRKADEERTSVSRIVIRTLETALGTAPKKRTAVLHHDLDALAGSWSEDEAQEFDRSLRSQRTIDAELWES